MRGRRRRGRRLGPGAAIAAVSLSFGVDCTSPCCTTDGFPINLAARTGTDPVGLLAEFRTAVGGPGNPDATPLRMSVDTGSALNLFRRGSEANQVTLRDFDLLDAQAPAGQSHPVRGEFREIEVLPLDLEPAPTGPDAVLGAALMQNFSIEFDFVKPAMTFWARQGASDGFLDAAGFAVLHFNLLGGTELTAESRPDLLGLTGPLEVPPTRVVLRACAAPVPFTPDSPDTERCCQRGDEVSLATGANLALVVATGVGPLVLSQAAWDRVVSASDPAAPPLAAPAPGAALSIPSLAVPLTDVSWSTIPRIALVNQELDDATNPGGCVDLGRARRLEWVERHQSPDGTMLSDGFRPSLGACALPCDTDPRDSAHAQNAAAYVELGGDIPVAILPDRTPLLQALRAEISPAGPEIDGLIGANLFAPTTMEIDYRSKPGRALIACAPGTPRSICWTSPRCPRLSTPSDVRACFGLTRRSLPLTCDASVCG